MLFWQKFAKKFDHRADILILIEPCVNATLVVIKRTLIKNFRTLKIWWVLAIVDFGEYNYNFISSYYNFNVMELNFSKNRCKTKTSWTRNFDFEKRMQDKVCALWIIYTGWWFQENIWRAQQLLIGARPGSPPCQFCSPIAFASRSWCASSAVDGGAPWRWCPTSSRSCHW